MTTPVPGLMCPKCRSTNVRPPSSAAMEDDDFRHSCAICLARFERESARAEYLRTFPEQSTTLSLSNG